MAIPARPTAHFIVIQPQVFAIFKILFNPPAPSQSRDLGEQRGGGRSKDQIIGQFRGGADGAADQQRVPAIIGSPVQQRHTRPVKEPGSFGALTHRQAVPAGVCEQQSRHVADFHPSHATRSVKHDGFVTGHSSHVGILVAFQPSAQLQMAAIDRVSHDPVHKHTSLMEAIEHDDGQVGFGAEGDRLGNACLTAPLTIVGPVLRQVEFAIDEGMAKGSDVGEEHAHLTVLHLASGAAILLFDACRVLSAFGKSLR